MLLLLNDDENESNEMHAFLLCKLISIWLFPSLCDSIVDHYQYDVDNDIHKILSCLNNQLKLLEIILIERDFSNNDDDGCSLLLFQSGLSMLRHQTNLNSRIAI